MPPKGATSQRGVRIKSARVRLRVNKSEKAKLVKPIAFNNNSTYTLTLFIIVYVCSKYLSLSVKGYNFNFNIIFVLSDKGSQAWITLTSKKF